MHSFFRVLSAVLVILSGSAFAGCYAITGVNTCANLPAARLALAPRTLAKTGFGGSGLIAFRPRFELWSDGATKQRWISLPEGAQIDTTDMDGWRFPRGTKLWKEFSHGGVRIETRYLEKTGDATEEWVTLSYVWNGNEAIAMPEGKADAQVPPARQCVGCHGGVPDRVLGFSAIQLEPELVARLAREGRFTRPPPHVVVPGNATDRAALGYLHANCSHCHNQHRPASSGPRCFDSQANIDLSLRTTDLACVEDTNVWRTTRGGVVAPGNPAGSALYRRVSGSPIEPRMPALGTEIRDRNGVALLKRWIEQMR